MKIAVRYLTIMLLSIGYSTVGLSKSLALDSTTVSAPDSTRVKVDTLSSLNPTIKPDDFNQGFIISPEQLIKGKVANVQITRENGPLGSSSAMYIRGNSTFLDENQPLIVIDDLPMPYWEQKGFYNKTNFLNTKDIESIKVIKGGPEASFYGVRGGNGVIKINTKNGGGNFHIHYDGNLAYQYVSRYYPVLSAEDYKKVVNNLYAGSAFAQTAIGSYSTDWQQEIYRNAYSKNHFLSISGTLGDEHMPFRISYGYLKNNTTLDKIYWDRHTLSGVIKPSFFRNHLKLSLKWNGEVGKNTFPDKDAEMGALLFNPTLPVYKNNDPTTGYFQYSDSSSLVPQNPVQTLKENITTYTRKRTLLQTSLLYNFHFAPSFHIKIGYGKQGASNDGIKPYHEVSYSPSYQYVQEIDYHNKYTNQWLNGELGFQKYWKAIKSKLEIFVQYSSHYNENMERQSNEYKGGLDLSRGFTYKFSTQNAYLRYDFAQKYILEAALTKEKTSYNPSATYYFPGAALTWVLSNEGFLNKVSYLNRLSISYNFSNAGTMDRQAGGNSVILPDAYEYTRIEDHEINLSFDLFTTRLRGNLTVYNKISHHPFRVEPRIFISNNNEPPYDWIITPGSINNKGWEGSLSWTPIKSKGLSWSIGGNISENYRSEHTDTLIVNAYNYYYRTQVYDANGIPLEGTYTQKSTPFSAFSHIPTFTTALNSTLQFKGIDLSFSGRYSWGGNSFNEILALYANYESLQRTNNKGSNIPQADIHYFNNRQSFSTYYFQPTDFLKLDYVSLGYTLPVWKTKIRCYATWQDVLLWTNYKGLNPEVRRGIDFNPYPNTSTVSLGISVDL